MVLVSEKKERFMVLVSEKKREIYGACKWKKKRERKEEKKGDQDRISPYNYQMNTISSSQVMIIKNNIHKKIFGWSNTKFSDFMWL